MTIETGPGYYFKYTEPGDEREHVVGPFDVQWRAYTERRRYLSMCGKRIVGIPYWVAR